MFDATLINNKTHEKTEAPVFIKMNPILDVISYLKNDYNLTQSRTPNIFNFMTNNKINSYHNTAYVDNLFTYLEVNIMNIIYALHFQNIMVDL